MRSEMDIHYDDKKRRRMQPYIESVPRDVLDSEKRLKLNNAEQLVQIRKTLNELEFIMYRGTGRV